MQLSVIIPTHAPHPGRLRRTLAALRAQTLAVEAWETVIVDNASAPALDLGPFADVAPANARLVREAVLGLTAARRRGFAEAKGKFAVLVDDDNVLAPDYLALTLALFERNPRVGAMGGRSLPEFEREPPAWMREFDGLIACRDLGPAARVSSGFRPPGSTRNVYPAFAPVGAGMGLRLAAVQPWLDDATAGLVTDRRGGDLTSSGDNDIVLTLMAHGWEVGYFPELVLTHLIPASRTKADYLARLNRGIATSWMRVLTKHHANPWPTIPAWTIPLRQARAWYNYRAWAGPSEYIRWQGACGHFAGRRR